MMFSLRRDPALRRRLVSDLDGVARQFGLSGEEVEALRARDPRRLMDLGVHQYYVPQLLRVFFGAAYNSNASAALECYARAFPAETASALAHQARREGRA
jgi:protocatechuate 4,5-dioxygenase alpha chain